MSRMTDEKFLNSSAMICCDLWAQTRTQSTFEIVFSFSGYTKTRSWGNDPQSLIRCERRTENPSTKQRWTKRWQNEAGRSWSVIPFFLLQLTKCAVPSKVTAATKCIDVPSSVSTEKNDIVAFFLVYKPSTNKKIREQLCVCGIGKVLCANVTCVGTRVGTSAWWASHTHKLGKLPVFSIHPPGSRTSSHLFF